MDRALFQRSLDILDPLLRVRWGSACGCWVVDRKAYFPGDEIFYLKRREERLRGWIATPLAHHTDPQKKLNLQTWKDVKERLDSALEGRRIVFYPENLDQKAFDMLCAGDSQRYGGYSSFFDKLEEDELKAEQALKRKQTAQNENIASEIYDYCDFVDRRRQDDVKNGQKDLGMLIHGRPTGDKPLIQLTECV